MFAIETTIHKKPIDIKIEKGDHIALNNGHNLYLQYDIKAQKDICKPTHLTKTQTKSGRVLIQPNNNKVTKYISDDTRSYSQLFLSQ